MNPNHPLLLLFASALLLAGCAEYRAYRHLDRAIAHEANGNSETALAIFQAAVEICPEDAVLRRWLGRAYLRSRQYAAAQAEFETARALAPQYLIIYRDLALVSEAMDMPEAAIGWLEKAIAQVPAHEDSRRDLIVLYLAHEQLPEAQSLLETVVERWPQALWAHFQLGRLYLILKWPERAEESYRQVLAIEPQTDRESELHARAHGELGNVYYEHEDYERAEEYFKKALELNPLDDSSLNNLAWLYAIQGIHLREGIRLSRRSLRLRPHAPSYLDTLAELHYRLGNTERAILIIRQAIALQPDDPDLRTHLHRQLAKFTSGAPGKT